MGRRFVGSAPSVAADLVTKGHLDGATSNLLRGESGRTYQLISGTLRNSGSGWSWINDVGHRPSGVSSVSATSTYIEINTAAGAKVSSLQVTPDETFAAQGLRCGASVGLNSSKIFLYTGNPFSIGDRVYFDGSGWISENGVFSCSYNGAGALTLTHEPMGTGPDSYSMASTRGTALCLPATCEDTTTTVAFYVGGFGGTTGAASTGTAHTHPAPWRSAFGAATTALNAHVVRHGRRSVSPENPANVVSSQGNLWVTGVVEI